MKTDELFEVNPSKGCNYSIDFWMFFGCEPHPVLPSHLKIAEKNISTGCYGCLAFLLPLELYDVCDFLW